MKKTLNILLNLIATILILMIPISMIQMIWIGVIVGFKIMLTEILLLVVVFIMYKIFIEESKKPKSGD